MIIKYSYKVIEWEIINLCCILIILLIENTNNYINIRTNNAQTALLKITNYNGLFR